MASGQSLLCFLCASILLFLRGLSGQYQPNWDSLDKRPLPAWYDEAKIGIFIHWGVFSVPSFGEPNAEWFWNNWKGNNPAYVNFVKNNYPPGQTYADFARDFKAEFYNADDWAELFKASGAKYTVLTSKHHEGFTNWPSNHSFNWNSMAVGPNRDLVGELATAIRKTDLHFGLYHSLFEWFNPLFLRDQAAKWATRDFPTTKTMPELYEIVNAYKPEVIWSDGDGGAPSGETYWNATGFLAWLYNDSPVKDTVVVNDRWGAGCACHHGGFMTCTDNYNPGVLQKRKWENCMPMQRGTWGYRRNARLKDFEDIHDIIKSLAMTVSCGGNLLLNVGPTHDGRIVPTFEVQLRQMGKWLGVNGEAIYATRPWSSQNDTINKDVWYTSKKSSNGTDVYAISLSWPKASLLTLGAPVTTPQTQVQMLGVPGSLKWKSHGNSGLDIQIPPLDVNAMPCQWAWGFKLSKLKM